MGEVATLEKPATTDFDDAFLHGAHVECQAEAPRVTMVCGAIADWFEMDLGSRKSQCPICYTAPRCPICGVKLQA